MSTGRRDPGRVTLFVFSAALAGGLTAHLAAQSAQQPPTPSAPVRAEQGPLPADPGAVMPKPDAAGPAPGVAAGMPTPVKFTGNVGPGGSVVSPTPDGPAKGLDPAIEKLGPGGASGRTATDVRLGPGGALGQTSASAPTGPDGRPVSPPTTRKPARTDAPPQPEKKPATGGPTAQSGMTVFIDPATGQLGQPTAAQMRQLEAQVADGLVAPAEIVERQGVDGMIADVPPSLFPVVTATVGADGTVTIEERQDGQAAAGPLSEQPLRAEGLQRFGPAGDQDQNLNTPLSSDVTITIVNGDAAGEGFNDPTAVAPVFGNRGTTRGQQRLNAFRAAAEYWGSILRSTVPIRVSAQMNPQACTATSAILGSAGPNTVHRDFGGAPLAATWYVQALANSRNGADLDAGQNDISAQFNSDVDNPTCLGATSWWYGIGAPAPAGTIDYYTVVLHEIGHGIGVLSLVSLSTGAKFLGFDDAYERWLWDWNFGGWPGLSNAGRLASSVNTGQVIFWGPRATQAARGFLSAGLNSGYPRVFAPNPVQGGSSISHYDTVLTPNELMEPSITAPPGPYAYLTGGLLEDIGWRLLANGVFDYGAAGTWTWNFVDGWFQPTGVNPTLLEPWNGNFVGVYNGTWLWNETTSSWSQLTSAVPSQLKACGNNLLWASGAYGTWRWNPSTGWDQLTGSYPNSMDCLGGDAAWEGLGGTWLYNFSTSGGPGTGGWSNITGADPTGMRSCGSRLLWWWAGGTWAWSANTGWLLLTNAAPQSVECYRDNMAWESALGTWTYNFTTGWAQITGADPEQMLAWGPNLAWENAAAGTWIWDGGGWTQITGANPTLMEVLGPDLLWSFPAGTWVWSGGGAGGAAWTNITAAVPTQIVSTGAVK
jgi:hypothetical protein